MHKYHHYLIDPDIYSERECTFGIDMISIHLIRHFDTCFSFYSAMKANDILPQAIDPFDTWSPKFQQHGYPQA